MVAAESLMLILPEVALNFYRDEMVRESIKTGNPEDGNRKEEESIYSILTLLDRCPFNDCPRRLSSLLSTLFSFLCVDPLVSAQESNAVGKPAPADPPTEER
jgi:hypothetical protein